MHALLTDRVAGMELTEQAHAEGASCGWADLTAPILKIVMQQLPLSDRMQSCALVCASWARAASAATNTAGIVLEKEAIDGESLQHWLYKYGRGISKLQLVEDDYSDGFGLYTIPISKLQDVALHGVLLTPHSQLFSHLQAATGLTSLSLRIEYTTESCWVFGRFSSRSGGSQSRAQW